MQTKLNTTLVTKFPSGILIRENLTDTMIEYQQGII